MGRRIKSSSVFLCALRGKEYAEGEGPQTVSNPRATSDAGPISRILYGVAAVTVIPLGRPSLAGSSDLPGGLACRAGTHRMLPPGSLPIWSCSVWGLPCPVHYCPGGALLPHLFTLTASLRTFFRGRRNGLRLLRPRVRLKRASSLRPLTHGGMFSVALSVWRPLKVAIPDVIRHTALWSSDFPPSWPRGPKNSPAFATWTATIRSNINFPYYKMNCLAGRFPLTQSDEARRISGLKRDLIAFIDRNCMMVPHFQSRALGGQRPEYRVIDVHRSGVPKASKMAK